MRLQSNTILKIKGSLKREKCPSEGTYKPLYLAFGIPLNTRWFEVCNSSYYQTCTSIAKIIFLYSLNNILAKISWNRVISDTEHEYQNQSMTHNLNIHKQGKYLLAQLHACELCWCAQTELTTQEQAWLFPSLLACNSWWNPPYWWLFSPLNPCATIFQYMVLYQVTTDNF